MHTRTTAATLTHTPRPRLSSSSSRVCVPGGVCARALSQFVRHLPGFYPLFVDLMHCDSKELRQILREIFSQRIGTVLHERQQAL